MDNNIRTIRIGLTASDAAWDLVLHQIGIASRVISVTEDLYTEYSVIIITGNAPSSLEQKIAGFVTQGGCILITPKAADAIAAFRPVSKKVSSLPPAKNQYFEYHGILDIFSSLTYFSNGDIVHSVPEGKGFRYAFGLDLDLLNSMDTLRKSFFIPEGRMPNEVVSQVSKGTVRQLVFSLLKGMHHRQDLPFIHQWYYPGTERTIFTFRIDSDKGTKDQVEEIRSLSERHSVPTTWFLDVKCHEEWLPYFRTFGTQEIALHCYEHVLYRSASLNIQNFRKASTLLHSVGLFPKGITAPTGGWNHAYAGSIRELGFTYSSEFAYAYDDLPSFPNLNGEVFPLPQLPIHPVCIGTMLRARMTDEMMVRYYRSYIDRQLELNEPICLYQHPTHRHNGVFEEVFQYIDSLSIAKLSYSDYAEWWKQRDSCRTPVLVRNGIIETLSDPGTVMHRIILPDGKEHIGSLQTPVKDSEIVSSAAERDFNIPSGLMRSREFDLRHILQNALDWWIKTTE